jgi:hypothetical protein
MWTEDNPTWKGMYLCAWRKGEGWIYSVGEWTGKEWNTPISADPHMNQRISSPTEQWEMLDELAKMNK